MGFILKSFWECSIGFSKASYPSRIPTEIALVNSRKISLRGSSGIYLRTLAETPANISSDIPNKMPSGIFAGIYKGLLAGIAWGISRKLHNASPVAFSAEISNEFPAGIISE